MKKSKTSCDIKIWGNVNKQDGWRVSPRVDEEETALWVWRRRGTMVTTGLHKYEREEPREDNDNRQDHETPP